ncbi:MAG: LytR C-terminal domain-containing protein [Candidatus Zixiibacteriota bacterium]
MSAQTGNKKENVIRILQMGLVLVFFVVVLFVGTFAVRVTRGVSKTIDAPAHMIRLEILNGCSQAGIASRAGKILTEYADPNLEIKVIATGDFDIRKVTKTFVIAREKDKTASKLLARTLGLDQSEVLYKPMENNYRQISTTLVLGEDHDSVITLDLLSKE